MQNSTFKLSEKTALIIAVFIAGLCSIVYELLISTTSSYFMGDSVKQFSLTIGIYMASMGVGSFLSQYIQRDLLWWFIWIELGLGFVGGSSVPILYWLFPYLTAGQYQLMMLSITGVIGALTGYEIPLLTRIMKKFYPLKTNLANVLSLDYIGALAATILFPFLLLPFFGLFRTSVAFGLVNIGLGFFIYNFFNPQKEGSKRIWIRLVSVVIILGFILLLIFSRVLLSQWENAAYSHSIIHAEQTPYQKLVLTNNKDETRLYLNKVIQFSSIDEYRYHESLALIPGTQVPHVKKVLILGGGEGLLAREVEKLGDLEQITIVDLDQRVFDMARRHPKLKKINEGVLDRPNVVTIAQDASVFLRMDTTEYDLILADLPDPSNEAVARLYSTWFYRMVYARLSDDGVFATQAGGPFHTRNAYWCITKTVEEVGFEQVKPYHVYVPSFGEWGFVMAKKKDEFGPLMIPSNIKTQFLEKSRLEHHFIFDPDMTEPDGIKVNRLDQPTLLDYYLEDWNSWQKELL